jgi:hypothetical protein
MAARGTGFTTATRYNPLSPKRLRVSLVACVSCAVLAPASPTFGAEPGAKAVGSLSQPKTAFQCEKKFKTSQGRTRCFSQLPGASCAHPLVAEKAGDTTRGEHRYFRLGFREDSYSGGVELHYSYAPATPNVAMCPYPVGAVYKDSLYSQETHCQSIHRNGHVEEYCSSEYDTHNHPEPVGRSGGSFTFDLKYPRIGYLEVKGYFIHPPWAHHR